MDSILMWLQTFFANNQREVVFSVLSFLGANYHLLQGRMRKTISSSWVEYWFIDNRLNSAGAIGALVAAVATAIGTGILKDATLPLLVISGFTLGYQLDSMINKGTPGTATVTAVNNAVDAGKIDATGKKDGGFVLVNFIATLFAVMLIGFTLVSLSGCPAGGMTAVKVDTKNKAEALTYYSLGQGYALINGAFNRKEISRDKTVQAFLSLDLASSLLDLTVSPASQTIQAALAKSADGLTALGALSPSQQAVVAAALNATHSLLPNGQLPPSTDTAAWLSLGADLLRSASSLVPVK